MDEKNEKIVEDVEINVAEEVENVEEIKEETKQEKFESILEKINKISEAIQLHADVKMAVEDSEVEETYLRYVENTLEDKFFSDAKFNDDISAKILLEIVCPELAKIENFDIEKLVIQDIGSHFEEQENYIDKICTYENSFICLFGINENSPEKVIKYESRKFTRTDMIEAVKAQYADGEKVDLYQYDEYYIGIQEDKLKVFSERKITALVAVQETVFDKIKSKLLNIFNINIFSKKKYLPNINLVYETNPNRIEELKNTSKVDAKNRMKILLRKEREVTRNTAI